MSAIMLCILSVSLATDAFAVSLGLGMVLHYTTWKINCKVGVLFGVFQGIMPLFGYAIAKTVAGQITSLAHSLSGLLLLFIGGKMIVGAFRKNETKSGYDPTEWKNLLLLAIATSLDALAVGASFAMMPETGVLALQGGVWIACAVITVITAVLCVMGCHFGCRTGEKLGKKAELGGGLVLVGIALKLFLEEIL